MKHKKWRSKVSLAGGKGPVRKHMEPIYIIVSLVELGIFANLQTTNAPRAVKIAACVLIALVLAGLAMRPGLLRKEHAMHTARWRALRKISSLDPVAVTDYKSHAGTAEDYAFIQGVTATLDRVKEILKAEEDAAYQDLSV